MIYTMDFLVNAIDVITFIILVVSIFTGLFTTIYLTIKLRKKKFELINAIGNSAPKAFKNRAFLSMKESMPSWVVGSMYGYIWFALPILYSGFWKIKKHEIYQWRQCIKESLGLSYSVYLLCAISWNIGTTLIIYLSIRYYWPFS